MGKALAKQPGLKASLDEARASWITMDHWGVNLISGSSMLSLDKPLTQFSGLMAELAVDVVLAVAVIPCMAEHTWLSSELQPFDQQSNSLQLGLLGQSARCAQRSFPDFRVNLSQAASGKAFMQLQKLDKPFEPQGWKTLQKLIAMPEHLRVFVALVIISSAADVKIKTPLGCGWKAVF